MNHLENSTLIMLPIPKVSNNCPKEISLKIIFHLTTMILISMSSALGKAPILEKNLESTIEAWT